MQLKGSSVPQSDSIKYLGVTVDCELKWKPHLANFHKKALAAIACIQRASPFLPLSTRKMLYQTLVLPHLEYCSVVWPPCSQALSQSIESILNYAMRVIPMQEATMYSKCPLERPTWLVHPPPKVSQPHAVSGTPMCSSTSPYLSKF